MTKMKVIVKPQKRELIVFKNHFFIEIRSSVEVKLSTPAKVDLGWTSDFNGKEWTHIDFQMFKFAWNTINHCRMCLLNISRMAGVLWSGYRIWASNIIEYSAIFCCYKQIYYWNLTVIEDAHVTSCCNLYILQEDVTC